MLQHVPGFKHRQEPVHCGRQIRSPTCHTPGQELAVAWTQKWIKKIAA